MDQSHIIEKYTEYVLEKGEPPPSVYRFAKDLEMTERAFFEQFSSFEALEAAIWKGLVSDTIDAVSEGAEWEAFTAQQKLLTFYYAFFEKALDHRSFLLARFPRWKKQTQLPSQLRQMKDAFTGFARDIVSEGTEKSEIACRGKVNHTYPAGMFGHFVSAIQFNLRDDSQGFERTDAYIEKSVKLGFDLIGSNVLESAFDLARFLSGRSRDKDSGESL